MIQYVNALLKKLKAEQSKETHWFPTPPEPGDETQDTSIQNGILQELIASERLVQLNPQDNQEFRIQFLSKFDWTDSTLDTEARKANEELVVEFNDFIARHRFDIDIKNDFKVTLTPIDENPAYNQNLLTPINLKENITVELALLRKYGIITTLAFGKKASLIFAQKNQR